MKSGKQKLAYMLAIVEQIRSDREWKNERILSWFRFSTSFVFSFFDLLAYLGYLEFTNVTPTRTTLLIDFFLILYGAIVLKIVYQYTFLSKLKYFVILFDYFTIILIFKFDLTVATKGDTLLFTIFLATFYFYFLNLLRYSKSGTIFAMFIAISFFEWNRYSLLPVDVEELLPMRMALLIILFIGYAIIHSQDKMMKEVGTKKLMERYLAPELVDHLDKGDKSQLSTGMSKNLAILFSDIRSFTSFSEKLKPDEVVRFLNEYLTLMTEQILSEDGMIDKFIGDAILATYGLTKTENKSLHAVLSAIKMIQSISKIDPLLKIGIGIHTGNVTVGNIGSINRFDFTVIGDTVNLASRIESLTKVYQCGILASESTIFELPKDTKQYGFLIREVDRVRVHGKQKAVTVFEIIPI